MKSPIITQEKIHVGEHAKKSTLQKTLQIDIAKVHQHLKPVISSFQEVLRRNCF